MFNADLIDDLAREKVALFLGAGVSASASTSGGGKIAGWHKFLEQTSAFLDGEAKKQVDELLNRKDYLLACEILQTSLAETWGQKISDEFGQKANPSELHKAIIRLKQRIILTTNFDKLLENAWETADAEATHYPNLITQLDENVFRALKDHSRTYIIKIHGTVDNPDAMVFSRSEYIKSAFGNLRYAEFLESILLNYTILFVGFSLDDPAITSLMEMYALRFPGARPHYIFSPGPIPSNIIEINKRLRKLVHIIYDPADDHGELTKKINQLANLAADRRREVFAEFVSQESEALTPSGTEEKIIDGGFFGEYQAEEVAASRAEPPAPPP